MENETLLEQFYKVQSIESKNDTTWEVTIELNPGHPVYQGHFPGEPVTPGVCMLQIIKECISGLLGKPFYYKRVNSCKFLSVINPYITPILHFLVSVKEQEDHTFQVTADGVTAEIPFIKLKGTLAELDME